MSAVTLLRTLLTGSARTVYPVLGNRPISEIESDGELSQLGQSREARGALDMGQAVFYRLPE